MMRAKLAAATFLIVVSGGITSCGLQPTEPNTPSFFAATIADGADGSVQGQYNGTGTFDHLPHGPVRFTLVSHGVGESAYEGMALHAVGVPAIGEYLTGELNPTSIRAAYWRDEPGERGPLESKKREIFSVHSGVLRISESSSYRVTGEFAMQATRTHDCTIDPGIPAPFVNCKPAREQAEIEITGSFDAIPLGHGHKGLTRFSG